MEIVSGWLLASPWLSASSVVSLKDEINTINLISNVITYTVYYKTPRRKGIWVVHFGSTDVLIFLIQNREESEQGIKESRWMSWNTSCWCCAAWLGFWEGVWAPLAPPSGGSFSPESPPWCSGSTPVSLLYWRPSGGWDDEKRRERRENAWFHKQDLNLHHPTEAQSMCTRVRTAESKFSAECDKNTSGICNMGAKTKSCVESFSGFNL